MKPLLQTNWCPSSNCKFYYASFLSVFFCFLAIYGCDSNNFNCYSSSLLSDKILAIKRDKSINFGSWDLALVGDIEDCQVLDFDYTFWYFDKSHQVKVSCVNAYGQTPDDEISVNLFTIMTQLLCAKGNLKQKLSDEGTLANKIFGGNDVTVYETKYAKGFIFQHSVNQHFVYCFSLDEKHGFLLVLTSDSPGEKYKPEAVQDFACKLAASVRFFPGKPKLDKTDFDTIFDSVCVYNSASYEEQIIMKRIKYKGLH